LLICSSFVAPNNFLERSDETSSVDQDDSEDTDPEDDDDDDKGAIDNVDEPVDDLEDQDDDDDSYDPTEDSEVTPDGGFSAWYCLFLVDPNLRRVTSQGSLV
jgi:hypothetical protein